MDTCYAPSPPDNRNVAGAQLLQAAVDQAFNAVVITNADLSGSGPVIIYCNAAFSAMTGYSHEELLGRSPRILQGPETDAEVISRLRQCLMDGSFFQGFAVNYRKDGAPYYVSWNISAVRDADGHITHYVSVQQDVTQQVESDKQRDLMAHALNATNAPVMITDQTEHLVFVNRAFERQTGYRAAEVLGRTPRMLRSGSHTPEFYSELREKLQRGDSFSRTFINKRKDGEIYHAEHSISALRDARQHITHHVSFSKDISNLVQREQELRVQAYRDELTGLLNRSAGRYELESCQSLAERNSTPYGLILCDIDLFKQVNDQFGHAVGDQVLVQVARLLRRSVRSTEHIVRWGGEEFLIIVPSSREQSLRNLAERIRKTIAGHEHAQVGSVTLSLGVGCWQQGETPADLLQRTDMALYQAKNAGRNRIALAHAPHHKA
ncbi:sensor domain-containing diguanylate cyclase [Comamonas sp. 26]|uniref:sensor domain-containing diguanylate cyclase n=1 Tax=Comamonas sp. 26 TaxID=2035201 RepID=UPI000C17AC5E|nr:sensor domain-containing diguanylate cyclase [Comamonas sp. 26]PIG09476.1 diguanylate cyclase with PAS/PAC sensor [Comamonas sp. 26]